MPKLKVDFSLIPATLILMGFSLALIWSTNSDYFLSQVIFFIVGIFIFIFVSQLNKHSLYKLSKPLYLICIIILLFSLFSSKIRGASRWIEIFGITLQPSEIVKPILIISFAQILSEGKGTLVNFFKKTAYFVLPILIIFLQPDLGNVIIYLIFIFSMLVAKGLNFKWVISLVIFCLLISPYAWTHLKDYQKQRVITFINPQSDPLGAGYNAIQSMITVGSGGLFGKGLGKGTQNHLKFLPENHTDFIFASLSEELGFFGVLILCLAYIFLLFKIVQYAGKSDCQFDYLVYIGIFSQFLWQIFINISMNIGIIPITGVTLPLVSAGGSSVIATFIALGIIVAFRSNKNDSVLVIR